MASNPDHEAIDDQTQLLQRPLEAVGRRAGPGRELRQHLLPQAAGEDRHRSGAGAGRLRLLGASHAALARWRRRRDKRRCAHGRPGGHCRSRPSEHGAGPGIGQPDAMARTEAGMDKDRVRAALLSARLFADARSHPFLRADGPGVMTIHDSLKVLRHDGASENPITSWLTRFRIAGALTEVFDPELPDADSPGEPRYADAANELATRLEQVAKEDMGATDALVAAEWKMLGDDVTELAQGARSQMPPVWRDHLRAGERRQGPRSLPIDWQTDVTIYPGGATEGDLLHRGRPSELLAAGASLRPSPLGMRGACSGSRAAGSTTTAGGSAHRPSPPRRATDQLVRPAAGSGGEHRRRVLRRARHPVRGRGRLVPRAVQADQVP